MAEVAKEYTLEEYIRPIWAGDTVAHESVLFREDEHAARLTYPMAEVLEVRSADLRTEYEEGRDWALEYGCLVRLPGSRMPFIPLDRFYPAQHRDGQDFGCTEPGRPLLGFGEGDSMIRYMVDVTYRHTEPWKGPEVPVQREKLRRFFGKLERGEEVVLLFYGDSITTGANSSGTVGVPPYAHPFPEMTAEALAKKYGYRLSVDVRPYEELKPVKRTGERVLHYVNTAVGGMDSVWGLANADVRVNAYHPDLIVLAFGMNDGWKSREEYASLTERTVEVMQRANPEADIVLLSSILPHWRAAGFFGHQNEFEFALERLAEADPHIALAPMTRVHRYLLSRKQYYHASGNNINHPSDFMARVYAMVLLRAMGAEE